MKLTVYAPTSKGIKRGLKSDDRIVFVNEHYVWLKQIPNGYRFGQGDVFEWKPRKRKPDSLWAATEIINGHEISNVDDISDYNLKVNQKELDEILKIE